MRLWLWVLMKWSQIPMKSFPTGFYAIAGDRTGEKAATFVWSATREVSACVNWAIPCSQRVRNLLNCVFDILQPHALCKPVNVFLSNRSQYDCYRIINELSIHSIRHIYVPSICQTYCASSICNCDRFPESRRNEVSIRLSSIQYSKHTCKLNLREVGTGTRFNKDLK